MISLLRDKTRDKFCKLLSDIGLEVEMAERNIIEEKLFNPWHRRSLGVIKINSESLIKYINIIKKSGSKNDPPRWWIYLAVPADTSKSQENSIEVKSIRNKTFPIFGKVKSINWQHNSYSRNLADIFTKDSDINELAMQLGNIKVQSLHEDFSGYSIELEFTRSLFPLISAPNMSISINQWNTFNKISKLLLQEN
tara:strand:- start:1487 stop:2071 length:585 start_codon:yes stop_codon:yes gene_type:complete